MESGGTINANPIKQYAYFPFYIDAVASVWYDANSNGNLSDGNDGRYLYLHDANFNVVALVDGRTSSLNVIERYVYTPYGEVTILNGASDLVDGTGEWSLDADQVSDIDNELLFTGRRLDPKTGLYQFRHRYYHAQMGRFLNRDPIGYLGGDANLYAYVGNMPTYYEDPSGLKVWKLNRRINLLPNGKPSSSHFWNPVTHTYIVVEDENGNITTYSWGNHWEEDIPSHWYKNDEVDLAAVEDTRGRLAQRLTDDDSLDPYIEEAFDLLHDSGKDSPSAHAWGIPDKAKPGEVVKRKTCKGEADRLVALARCLQKADQLPTEEEREAARKKCLEDQRLPLPSEDSPQDIPTSDPHHRPNSN